MPAAEVKAILEAEGYSYANVSEFDQILRLETEVSSVQSVEVRSAYTRFSALELFVSDATPVSYTHLTLPTNREV